jgi:hypothetical protein
MILSIKLLNVLVMGHWLVSQADLGYRQYLAAEAVRDYGGFVYHDSDFVGNERTPGRRPWAPASLRKLVGEDFFQDVVEVNLVYGTDANKKRIQVERTDDEVIPRLLAIPGLKRLYIYKGQASDRAMETVAKLTNLEVLMMWEATVTDAGIERLKSLRMLNSIHVDKAGLGDDSLKHLSSLPLLHTMNLQGNRFTDKGLAYLKDMRRLKQLVPDNGDTDITDAGMAHLSGLVNLERLGIQQTRVTDEGLKHLVGLKKLKDLWASGSLVTDEGIEKLRAELPTVKVNR